MNEEARSSCVDIIEDVPKGTHLCQFYWTKEDLLDILVPYFKAGLENNELCIWITSKHFAVEEAKEALKRAIPNFDTYLKNEQVEIISYTNWYLKESTFDPQNILKGWIKKLNIALINGYEGLRFTEDTFWLRKDSRNNLIDYEKRLNSIIRKYPLIALHTYPLDMYNDTDVIEIALNHHFSLAKVLGKWKRIESSGQEVNNESRRAKEILYNNEAQCRSLYKNSLDAILLTRPDGTILSANPQACKFFGMTESEIKKAGREGIVVYDEKFAAALEERNLTGRAKAELTFKRKDGSTFVGEASSNVFRDINGSLMTSMIIRDVTERKKAEETLAKIEIARKQEIHRRVKNNLQVISSLLDLQAEQFRGRKNIGDSKILEAFRENQNRVISMALIHEELYKGGEIDTLNFSPYIEKLVENLFQSYNPGNIDIDLYMDLEENIFLYLDVAVPLGMIVNEIISYSFKYAFSGRNKGEIKIKLHKIEDTKAQSTGYILSISDNRIGIPEKIDFENSDILSLQLMNLLVDQLDGEIELKRDEGTEFRISFRTEEKRTNQSSRT